MSFFTSLRISSIAAAILFNSSLDSLIFIPFYNYLTISQVHCQRCLELAAWSFFRIILKWPSTLKPSGNCLPVDQGLRVINSVLDPRTIPWLHRLGLGWFRAQVWPSCAVASYSVQPRHLTPDPLIKVL